MFLNKKPFILIRMLKMLIRVLVIFILCQLSNYLIAQGNDPVQIAEAYYNQGQFEKAERLFRKLARDKQYTPTIHKSYLKLMLSMEHYGAAEKYLKRAIKNYPGDLIYQVDMGILYRTKRDTIRMNKVLDALIIEVTEQAASEKQPNSVRFLAQLLYDRNFSEKTLQAFKSGREVLGRPDLFSIELANLYRLSNKKEEMVGEYLNFLKYQPGHLDYVRNSLQLYLKESQDLDMLETRLYDFIQKEVGNPVFNQLLVWTHLQQNNFSAALRHARALDRRLGNNGDHIMNVGMIAYRNRDYEVAKKSFGYVLTDFRDGPNYTTASLYVLFSEESLLTETHPVNKKEVHALIVKYKAFASMSKDVFSIMEVQRRIALLQAFQLNEIEQAIETLTDLLARPVGRHKVVAHAKMDLADIYLLNEQPWESILLYGQVERMFKDEPLGYQAKLKSARLSYYKGDFELAQSSLDILKLATSREIANDAIDLSMLIRNNTVFDTTDFVMQQYANIELMLFQNQKEEGLVAMDSMLIKCEGHAIVDELLYLKAGTLREIGRFTEALAALELINNRYYLGILGDDALFLKGTIEQDDIGDKEKAMATYTDLLRQFPGSIYVSEARSRFRKLRGDFNQ